MANTEFYRNLEDLPVTLNVEDVGKAYKTGSGSAPELYGRELDWYLFQRWGAQWSPGNC